MGKDFPAVIAEAALLFKQASEHSSLFPNFIKYCLWKTWSMEFYWVLMLSQNFYFHDCKIHLVYSSELQYLWV